MSSFRCTAVDDDPIATQYLHASVRRFARRVKETLSRWALSLQENLSGEQYHRIIWLNSPPRNRWHSWDSQPWRHPWLRGDNLRAMRDFSLSVWEQAQRLCASKSHRAYRYGFVGNLANNLYARAVPLRKAGIDVSIFLHAHDTFVMSQPGWEEFDGELPDGVADLEDLLTHGIALPEVPDVYRYPVISDYPTRFENLPHFVRFTDFLRWMNYLCNLPTLQALQRMDALLTVQVPYVAYLSNRPYLVTQMGGDIWYDCSRDDQYGHLQRKSFAAASAFLVSNPWSFAHARRFGMRHLIYVPLMIDENVYCPGDTHFRSEWQQRSGGSFFVLSTARLDNFYKGSDMAVKGFVEFSRRVPRARLILMGWGSDKEKHLKQLDECGVRDKVIVLPIAGKRRLVQYLRAADCLLDQFVLGYFGATALEAMACGLPVIMRLERMQYDALCLTGAPPVLMAETPEQICAALVSLALEPEKQRLASLAHREWFLANHGSTRLTTIYGALLQATALGHRFSFARSPLATSLTREEQNYHTAELAKAPLFPRYR
jgi:glycosyltransferase involved in cell wall biosynthesis